MLDCADLADAVALAERVERAQTGAVDVVAAARTVLVTARQASELPQLRRTLEALLGQDPSEDPSQDPLPPGPIRYPDPGSGCDEGVADVSGRAGGGRVVTLDVRYDGPDLADVAELAGVSTEALVRMHTSITWRAAFGGFAPGFFYLVDARELGASGAETARPAAERAPLSLPTVPRLGSPRPRVPAGSVAMADRFCAVYPGASPGGWRLLGTTDAPLWDVNRPRPALLEPGTLVRFRDLDSARGENARGERDLDSVRGENVRGENARGGNPGDTGAAP